MSIIGSALEPGRKNTGKKGSESQEKFESISVVGYACKLFRDDDAAVFIDEGKHLIPWNGTEDLLVDRYDCRGYIYSIEELDRYANKAGTGHVPEPFQNEEALCERERYMDLEACTSVEETPPNRSRSSGSEYSTVPYMYPERKLESIPGPRRDPTVEPATKFATTEAVRATAPSLSAVEGSDFLCPPSLKVPPGMALPETQKLFLIMERTSAFISTQGAQMEIVLKAKQSGNPQFDFLAFDHALNPFYKLLLMSIKEGTYTPSVLPTPTATAVKTASCNEKGGQTPPQSAGAQAPDSDSDSDGDYELHPLLRSSFKTIGTSSQDHEVTSALAETQKPIVTGSHRDPGPAHSVTPQTSMGVAVTQNSLSDLNQKFMNLYYSYNIGQIYTLEQWSQIYQCYMSDATYSSMLLQWFNSFEVGCSESSAAQAAAPPPPPPSLEAKRSKQSAEAVIPPPPDLKLVVDKMAEYVAKNGKEFERVAKKKKDPTYAFLKKKDTYHPYYRVKLKAALGAQRGALISPPQTSEASSQEVGTKRARLSFKLKKVEKEKTGTCGPTATSVLLSCPSDSEEEDGGEVTEMQHDTSSWQTISTPPHLSVFTAGSEVDQGPDGMPDSLDQTLAMQFVLEHQELMAEQAKAVVEQRKQDARRRRLAAVLGFLKQSSPAEPCSMPRPPDS